MKLNDKLIALRKYIAKKYDVQPDRWGHIVIERADKKYRFKFMEKVIRYEGQVKGVDGNRWIRILSYSVTETYDTLSNKGLL